MKPVRKVCAQGHVFFKSSDCPVCPKCEAAKTKEKASGLPKIGAPATRALNRLGVTKLAQLGKYSERDLLELHGFGPKAMTILKEELSARGLSLKKK